MGKHASNQSNPLDFLIPQNDSPPPTAFRAGQFLAGQERCGFIRSSASSNAERKMKMKTLVLGLAVQAMLGAAAQACDGQTGSVIFEDNFADDSGGWDLSPPGTQVKPPNFVFTMNKNTNGWATDILTFNAGVGDYCADFVLPKAPAADNNAGFGLMLWGADYSN
jgi:hypothetical protein